MGSHYCKRCNLAWMSPVPNFYHILSNSVHRISCWYLRVIIHTKWYIYAYHPCICICDAYGAFKNKITFSLFSSMLSGILRVYYDTIWWLEVVIIRIKIGTLSKPRRQRQQKRHQTKGLMSRTITVHVRYKSLCIS